MKYPFRRILALSLILSCILLAACSEVSPTISPTPAAVETPSPPASTSMSPSPSPLPSPGEIDNETYMEYYAAYQKPVGGGPLDIPSYPFKDLTDKDKSNFTFHFDYGQWVIVSGDASLVPSAIQAFPTTAIRYFPDDPRTLYFVYDTDIGARVFLFDNRGGFILRHFCIIMMKKLSHEDFADLKVGDAVEKAASIDPIVSLYQNKFDEKDEWRIQKEEGEVCYGNCAYYTLHLLTDGILRIGYSKTKKGGYVIKSIEYNEDFKLMGYAARYDIEYYGVQSFRIDPQDYVD